MEVQPVARTQYILGKRVSHMDLDEMDAETQPNLASITTDLQFIYLDSDLCITMIGDESGILNVYTKNAEWRESRKKKVSVLLFAFEKKLPTFSVIELNFFFLEFRVVY